eukprot:TRINITY_DN343_c0_g2_i2.p1 TRINITY_DN343_c0_g2~~TRINITY_DN343_c0_g2_i2.p1  ORF type:complete len:198 (-),score=52.20 TRINITY_DN343_c0_g2_i2:173-766(-)
MYSDKVFEQLFQLKFASKQLARQSKRAQKEAQIKKKKVLEALRKANAEAARIHANDVIRKQNEALSLLHLSSKIDGMHSRLQTMANNKQSMSLLAQISAQMEQGSREMNAEKIGQVVNQFERNFEDLEVATAVVEESMDKATANLAKTSDVDQLICQVADQYHLELKTLLPELAPVAEQQRVANQKISNAKKHAVLQ